ncbi:MAG: ADP-dependent glucokinase/phosphofructokinase [Limnochordia bacterium]|jgi:ADP-dependent phosphofructokinase/glucokinase
MANIDQLRNAWDQLYQENLPQGFATVRELPGVVVGIHSVIDGLKRLDIAQLERILADDPSLADAALEASEKELVPGEINTPRDFIIGLFTSFSRGKALQLMIRQESAFNWVLEKLGYDYLRMGGTSGNMANSLSPLGFPMVVYANPLTRELAELFVERPNLKVLAADGTLKAPKEAAQGDGIKALHMIVEYSTGDTITVKGKKITTPRANRFIAAWNPVNNKLQIDPTWKDNFLAMAGQVSHFVVSGFHILSEHYPDGSTYADYLAPVGEYLAQVRARHPHLRLHYEFASIASSQIRQGILKDILPRVHSLGLNEVELAAVLDDIGAVEEAAALRKGEGMASVLKGMDRLMRYTGLDRIQLHDLGYYLTLVRSGYAPLETTRTGLILAATLAASRTATGKVGTESEIRQGLEFAFMDAALEKAIQIGEYIGDDQFATTGLGAWQGWDVAYLPTRVVPKPVLTVGLGDLISASAFVVGSPAGG